MKNEEGEARKGEIGGEGGRSIFGNALKKMV